MSKKKSVTNPVLGSVPNRHKADPNSRGPRGGVDPSPKPRVPGDPHPGKLPGLKTPHLPGGTLPSGPSSNIGPA